eukprot:CAMPEP_0194762660 /NCGR_PEP_ID=MMETSP0323_2-20130528/16490_1 /TAXON_ID=2866 ORGANISM="Crypthecodinium cohnii, Strain Seligo" /NCGR_SAMPLE_ID=MMETSP0323_2 /ASSEMBLY_ACC=CAM_ASM_000346 /LENGTH=81 /DNA_ID=CAMNT_0039685513 /DNA_START=63 /DNA_END=304 /DNA_ORIENTATION=-
MPGNGNQACWECAQTGSVRILIDAFRHTSSDARSRGKRVNHLKSMESMDWTPFSVKRMALDRLLFQNTTAAFGMGMHLSFT